MLADNIVFTDKEIDDYLEDQIVVNNLSIDKFKSFFDVRVIVGDAYDAEEVKEVESPIKFDIEIVEIGNTFIVIQVVWKDLSQIALVPGSQL